MTQQEFLQIAEQKHWNLEKMRFFIGERRQEPKCFGVYQDGTDWVCYKMKGSGEYVEHYRGSESQAFQIIYDKILSEIRLRAEKQKGSAPRPAAAGYRQSPAGRASEIVKKLIVGCAVVLVGLFVVLGMCLKGRHKTGYYLVDNDLYYQRSGDWYGYDDSCGWYVIDDPEDFWYDDYYDGDTYAWDAGNTWEDSEWPDQYQNDTTQDDDYDYDDYDTDDWDAGDTDWDTDW
jgi:hypothetical protein